jgi:hypothetical protein
MSQWLSRFVFCHTHQTRPDGRPLYAYKVSDQEYAELRQEVLSLLGDNLPLRADWAPLFCLYAAEAFNREYVGGPWSWETVFNSIRKGVPAHPYLAEWSEKGLKWWQRRVIRSKQGHREFLLSLICEGGLPLSVLQREDAGLRRYFSAVLDAIHHAQEEGVETAVTHARDLADLLPASLREEQVFRLTGELIAGIVNLIREIGDAEDPIQTLDLKKAGWRKGLPLRVEEGVAEILLRGLVTHSRDLVRRAGSRLQWKLILIQSTGRWEVEKRLEIPGETGNAQVKAWSNAPNLGLRLRLVLNTVSGTIPVAWLTALFREDGETVYRREWLTRGGALSLKGDAIQEPHQLILLDDGAEYPLAVAQGGPLGPIPWIWAANTEGYPGEFIAEGSAKTRLTKALVCIPWGIEPSASSESQCDLVGELRDPPRAVCRVAGQCDFFSSDGDRYRITCGAPEDSAAQYELAGPTLEENCARTVIYRGLPSIRTQDRAAIDHAVQVVEWKPVGSAGPWRVGAPSAWGKLWVRLVARGAMLELFRRQAQVAPPDLRITKEIGVGTVAGEYIISGLNGAFIHFSPEAQEVQVRVGDTSVRVSCPHLEGSVLPRLSVTLRWPDRDDVDLELAYPQRGAAFELGGNTLSVSGFVPLSRLDGVRLIVQDPHGGTSYFLEAVLVVGEMETEYFFSDRLPPLAKGRVDLSLTQWRDRIISMVVSSSDSEAKVRLSVLTGYSELIARVFVGRFDASLRADKVERTVRIDGRFIANLGLAKGQAHFEMLPLWAPASTPLSLAPHPDLAWSWSVPSDLAPGPWWILAGDGAWARFRPLLWVIPATENDEAAEGHKLAEAVREADPRVRAQFLNDILTTMGAQRTHQDWSLLLDYVRLAKRVPASSLDVLRALIAHPKTMVLALCEPDEKTFDAVWNLAEQMPFSWTLLSCGDWVSSGTHFRDYLRDSLREIEGGEDIVWEWFCTFRRRIQTRRDCLHPLCDVLQEALFPEKTLTGSCLVVARQAPAVPERAIQQAEMDLQARHGSDERWPVLPCVLARGEVVLGEERKYRHLAVQYRYARLAPFVAAYMVAKGGVMSEELIYEFRLTRAFDNQWFWQAYAAASSLMLATKAKEEFHA